jgi:hypothetical protein
MKPAHSAALAFERGLPLDEAGVDDVWHSTSPLSMPRETNTSRHLWRARLPV